VRTVTALLTNKAYGYPTRGARWRRKPTILACLHQTANAHATARQERDYANRAGSRCTDHARQSNRSRHSDPYSTRAWQHLSARMLRAWRGERGNWCPGMPAAPRSRRVRTEIEARDLAQVSPWAPALAHVAR